MAENLRARLRHLAAQKTLAVPGAFNALTAMLAEQAGFEAVYVSGAGLSNGAGFPDEGLLSLAEVVQQVRYITQAVSVPVLCDADTGFGEVLNVMRTVKEFEAAGAAGIHIEDQELPKRCGHLEGKRLVETEHMAEKIAAAVAGRADPNFLIIARTDARSVEGLEAAISRGRSYIDAGADGLFPEALESVEEFSAFARAMRTSFGARPPLLLANMTEFGKTPFISIAQFQKLGYALVIFPQTGLRIALKAMREAFSILKARGTQKALLDRMMTRQELYELLGYDAYKETDRMLKRKGD